MLNFLSRLHSSVVMQSISSLHRYSCIFSELHKKIEFSGFESFPVSLYSASTIMCEVKPSLAFPHKSPSEPGLNFNDLAHFSSVVYIFLQIGRGLDHLRYYLSDFFMLKSTEH